MATVVTKISDVIVPEIFGPYMIEKTTELSRVLSSGIATPDPKIAALINEGGKTINLPSWNGNFSVDDDDDAAVDGVAMSVTKITAYDDVACKHVRNKGFGATDLSKFFSGDDPMGAILECVGGYWARKMQKILLKTLEGVFKSASMASNVLDNSVGVISYETLTSAMYLLGDHYDSLTAVAMHSAVMNKLAQLKLLETYPNPTDRAPYYTSLLGKSIIVDDSLVPDENGVYPVYLFGAGSIAYNEATGIINAETDRDKQAGVDYLFTRRAFTMHPRGVKWVGTIEGDTPSYTELATGTNWQLVSNAKNVRIALLKTKIAE